MGSASALDPSDKPQVLTERFRVLAPGGRVGISDVVAEDDLTAAERAARGSYVGCIAGALSRAEYLEGLQPPGLSTSLPYDSPIRLPVKTSTMSDPSAMRSHGGSIN